MLTKADFLQKTQELIANYPAIAPLYNAGDPALLWMIESNAAMLAALSAQIEVAQTEPFEKVRDATVLADAAMRGIIRKAVSGRVQVLAKNDSNASYTVETGRVIVDTKGNYYIIETALTLASSATGTFEATQVKPEIITHTIAGSVPFYAIEIPESEDDSFLSGISVSDSLGEYEYRERYVNSWPNERIYHVEADDKQRVYVRFGQKDVVGTQPIDGTIITITLNRAVGAISPVAGSPFSFEYLNTVQESSVVLTMDTLLFAGENPLEISAMRDLARYPSVYQSGSAVFLGDFDFLVRVNFPTLQFLSVWNESVEETARGADVDNINTLFCAVLSIDGTESGLTEPDPNTPVTPTFILENDYTATQTAIKTAIKAADDSYRVKFYTFVRSKIVMTITATVSTSYVASDIESKIIEAILAKYGEAASASKRGSNQPLYREVYVLLKSSVPALSDGNADIKMTIAEPVGALRPELWRYVSNDSLTVTVTTLNITLPSWGGRS